GPPRQADLRAAGRGTPQERAGERPVLPGGSPPSGGSFEAGFYRPRTVERAAENPVDTVEERRALGVDAQRSEACAAFAPQFVPRDAVELVHRLTQRLAEELRGRVRVLVGAAGRLGHDRVDDAELEAVGRVGLEGCSGLLCGR